MYALVDNLADLTALRDRDALDVAVVNTVNDVVKSRGARIFRVVGEPGHERWRLSAQATAGQPTLPGSTTWQPLEQLPLLSDYPLRLKAVTSEQFQESDTGERLSVFPLGGTTSGAGVLEIRVDAALPAESRDLISGILRLYRNFSALLDYGERDSLTDLLNRKTFDGAFLRATLEQASGRASPQVLASPERRGADHAGSYWLAMIDIDHFKHVNDTYGHLIGDEVLLLLARLMRTHFRFHDQIYRFGGEEFVALVRCNSEAEALGVLERLRVTIQDHPFPQVGAITISIGFTEIRTGDSPNGALERADKAVYFAKEHGRNQVCSHGALVASGGLQNPVANVGAVELF